MCSSFHETSKHECLRLKEQILCDMILCEKLYKLIFVKQPILLKMLDELPSNDSNFYSLSTYDLLGII